METMSEIMYVPHPLVAVEKFRVNKSSNCGLGHPRVRERSEGQNPAITSFDLWYLKKDVQEVLVLQTDYLHTLETTLSIFIWSKDS